MNLINTITEDLLTVVPMLVAILRGKYKMPWGTLMWAVICLIYLLSPIDMLPDLLPIIGIADDGAFIVLVLTMIHKDLCAYRQAQKEKQQVIEAEIVEPKK